MRARKGVPYFIIVVIGVFLFSISSSAVSAASSLVNFEGGMPTGWFAFFGGSTVNTVSQVVADSDLLARPGQAGNNEILVNEFTVTDYGGFGQDLVIADGGAQDWSSFESFNFWFYGTGSGLAYQAEISDNRSDPAIDTSERFDYTFIDDTVGWRSITIPFADFTRATDFQPGGAPDDGFTLTEIYTWAIVLPQGADTIYFDDFSLGQRIVDDFEAGLPSGADGNAIPIGFYTFQGAGSSIAISDASTPPAPILPEVGSPNNVLQIDVDSTSYAGMIHGFESDDLTTWVPQDWSDYNGLALWLYGNNSGSDLFIDLLENRNPGSTTDDAERWTVAFKDDFAGWQYLQFPFDTFTVKGVGNGAPNDGLTLTEVHGWAFGVLGTDGARTYYIDDMSLYGIAEIPELAVSYSLPQYDVTEGGEAGITVKLTRELGLVEDDPAQVSIDYSTEPGTAVSDRDYTPVNGTFTFVQGDPTEQTFTIHTFGNSKYDGNKTVILRLSNSVDVAPGFNMQAGLNIMDDEAYDPLLLDDFERGANLWESSGDLTLSTIEISESDPMALPGQGAYETVLTAAPVSGDSPLAQSEQVIDDLESLLPTTDHTTNIRIKFAKLLVNNSLHSAYWTNDYYLTEKYGQHVFIYDRLAAHFLMKVVDDDVVEADEAQAAIDQLLIVDESLAQIALNQAVANNGRSQFIDKAERQLVKAQSDIANGRYTQAVNHYRLAWSYAERSVKGISLAEPSFGRDFALGQDWSLTEGVSFMYYGQGTGDTITMELLDNRAPDPGPSGWSMVWSDEFNEQAGTPPNPANWGYEIGDGTANGIPGWGNSELQYYTDSTENAATDGQGNLVISAKEADGSLTCYYGPCEYTSARLISWHKAEFAYGRIESRIQVPDGEAGLWPAFWSLGTDIDVVDWPQTGEIDIMEYVSRIPDEVFGTIHGPGYSGGAAYGNIQPIPEGVSGDYHTFTIEWQPDLIEWYVDGILYHTATPADVAPNEWVFNDPIFLLFNMAIGGNFGGTVSEDLTLPQDMVIDYVRVYQGPDTAERFETQFVDDFTGWQELFVSYDQFSRSTDQPTGAPDDGLTLTDVWGYGFKLPVNSTTATAMIDQVRLIVPTEVTVTNTNDDGSGSLRQAIKLVASEGAVYFDPSLANSTITLTSGPLVVNKMVNIDGSGALGLTVSGDNTDRVLVVESAGNATVNGLTFTDGYGWQLAGGVLNNGTLTLDHVTVTGNTMATDAGDFWQGGGGIYNGDGATLNLIDSTVSNNTSGWTGGGIYSFFNSNTSIIRSTISDNVALDVAGGLRILGSGEIVNSTLSGNTSTTWHGGALFLTDGVMNVENSTVVNNNAPAGTTGGLFVGTFGESGSTLNIGNSIVAANGDFGCFLAPFGSGAVALNSLGNNVFTDSTCNPVGSDQVVADAGVDVLADNGGSTLTVALLAGSPAIDTANSTVCPATDQRGIARDGACDVGAFEYVP